MAFQVIITSQMVILIVGITFSNIAGHTYACISSNLEQLMGLILVF